MDALKQQWNRKKQLLLGLVIGLLVGPLISGLMGWQVTDAFLTRSVHGAVVHEQVAFCVMRARAAVKNVSKMDFEARYKVAKQWSKMPGQEATDGDVVSACTYELAG